MSDNKKKPDTKAAETKAAEAKDVQTKKVEEKAAEIIQATETQTVKPAAAEDKEFKKKKSTTWERNQRKWGWAFILPTMIGIIVLNLWPIVQTIYQSFCKVGSFGDSSFAGFANYKKMFADPEVWQSLLNKIGRASCRERV